MRVWLDRPEILGAEPYYCFPRTGLESAEKIHVS